MIVYKYRVWCETEEAYKYVWSPTVPTVCPDNSGHSITTSGPRQPVVVNMAGGEAETTDGKHYVHDTCRPLGTYTYFTSRDDDHTDPHAVGGSDENTIDLKWDHPASEGNNPEVVYLDFNTINNETHVRQGDIMWKDAQLGDNLSFSIVPKTTSYSADTNTNFDLYGGYLIIPAAGDGTISVANEDMVLVQNVPNEYGNLAAGYWDADWNTTTKQFENIVANPYGTGEYNMFGLEVKLHCFMQRRQLLGSGRKDCMTNDIARLGHHMRMKIEARTAGTDHAWSGNGTLMMYRKKTT